MEHTKGAVIAALALVATVVMMQRAQDASARAQPLKGQKLVALDTNPLCDVVVSYAENSAIKGSRDLIEVKYDEVNAQVGGAARQATQMSLYAEQKTNGDPVERKFVVTGADGREWRTKYHELKPRGRGNTAHTLQIFDLHGSPDNKAELWLRDPAGNEVTWYAGDDQKTLLPVKATTPGTKVPKPFVRVEVEGYNSTEQHRLIAEEGQERVKIWMIRKDEMAARE